MNGRSAQLSELIAGLNPLRRATVTVNVEGSSLRMMASRGRRVLGWLDMPFNPTLVTDGQVSNPQEMMRVLRNALKRLDYFPANVRVAYSGANSVVRAITVPKTPGIRPEVVLERDARRLLGISAEQSHLFWHRIGVRPTELRYLLVAIAKPSLNNYLDALVQSGLRPNRIELKGLAMARIAGQARALTVSLELASIATTLVEGFVPELVTYTSLSDAVAFAEEDLGLQLVEEVRAAVEFFQQRFPSIPVAQLPVYLTGGHPLLESPRFPQLLAEALGVTPAPLVLEGFAYDDDLPVPAFLVNFGLLLARS